MKDNAKELGARLAKARRDASMSQQAVEQATGIDQTVVARMENGQRKIGALTIKRLADLYGIPVATLFEAANS